MIIVKAEVEKWDGKSKFEGLDPKLQNLMDIGSNMINTMLGYYRKYWDLYNRPNLLDDYEEANKLREENKPKIEELLNEAKSKSGIVNKFLETIKEVIPQSLWITDSIFPNSVKLTKNQGFSTLKLNASTKARSIDLSHKDYELKTDKFIKYIEMVKCKLELINYIKQIPKKFLQTEGMGQVIGVLPLYQLPLDIRRKVVNWWDLQFQLPGSDWQNSWLWWRDNISSDWANDINEQILNKFFMGIFEVSKNQILFETFRNHYEPGPLIRVRGSKMTGVGRGTIAIVWEDNITKKVINQGPYDWPNDPLLETVEQPINHWHTLTLIKTLYGKTPYKKKGNLVYEFYPKGFRIINE